MKFLHITFLILLVHQVYLYPASHENSNPSSESSEDVIEAETTTTEIADDIQTTTVASKNLNKDKDVITVEEFILASVLYDDVDDDENKKPTKVKREAPKDADKVIAKRAIVFRPLFVYKQQEIKRQKVQEQRKTTRRPVRTRPPTYGGNRPIG